MAWAVRTAERYVHVEFYIMSWDPTTKDFFGLWPRSLLAG